MKSDSAYEGNRRKRTYNLLPFDETYDFSTLKCPTLYIVGEEKKHEVEGVCIYPKQNENIHVAVVPFAGHLVRSEQPEVYIAILNIFINKVMAGDSFDD
jgi:pimeloyl-ACP methyl ester carboxylesterase